MTHPILLQEQLQAEIRRHGATAADRSRLKAENAQLVAQVEELAAGRLERNAENERLRAVVEAARHTDHDLTCKPSDHTKPCWCGHEELEHALAVLDQREAT